MGLTKSLNNKLRVLGFQETIRFAYYNTVNKQWQRFISETYSLKPKECLYPLFIRYGTSDRHVFRQIFIDQEYATLRLPSDIRLIVDCGANVGYASAYFLSRFPGVKVIAVEPDPSNFELLKRNMQPYEERVTLVHAGVWSHKAGLVVCPSRAGDEWSTQVRECLEGEVPDVLATDILSLIALSGMDRIDLLKVDIEGSETVVFGSNSRLWIEKVDNIVTELHGAEAESALLGALATADYKKSTWGELTICENIRFSPAT